MELIDRATLGREIPLKVCLPCPMGEDFECKDCLLDKAMGIIEAAPTIDAVPVEEIETYRKMWLARADKLRNSREGVAYSAMAYAAKVMLYFHEVSKHLQPPGADAKELKFMKWDLFDNADPKEEKE